MKLITNNKTYPVTSFRPSWDGCVITAVEPVDVGATLCIETDEGAELRTYTVADWLRCVADGCTVRLTNTPEPAPVPVDLDALRETRIAESKTALDAYLEDHPLLWTDGKRYSVTDKKTTLLTKAILTYQIKLAAGVPAVLKWNDTGEVCTEWTLEDLSALAIAIDGFVAPLVAHQQTLEVMIRGAATEAEIRAVEIAYGQEGENA